MKGSGGYIYSVGCIDPIWEYAFFSVSFFILFIENVHCEALYDKFDWWLIDGYINIFLDELYDFVLGWIYGILLPFE